MTKTEVRLHSNDPEAVTATRETMRQLGSDLIEEDGKFYVPGSKSDYPAWAALRQGYIAGVVE